MSILNEEETGAVIKDWRYKRVWHTTPITRERNYVLVKSLPPEEQEKYKPMELKLKEKEQAENRKKGKRVEPKKINYKKIKPIAPPPKPDEFFIDVYFGVANVEDYDKFEEGELVKVTTDSAKAINISEAGKVIVAAKNIPISSFKKYKDEDGEWNEFETMSNDKKYEFVKFNETGIFMVDLYSFKDYITLEVQEHTKDNGEEKMETFQDYLRDKKLQFLIESGEWKSYLINEDELNPKAKALFDTIADKLRISFDGFTDMMGRYILWFTDTPPYKENINVDNTLEIEEPETFETFYDKINHKLINKRKEFLGTKKDHPASFTVELKDIEDIARIKDLGGVLSRI